MCGAIAIRFTSSHFLRLGVLLCLLMSSCGSEVPFPRCISAENFSKNTTIAVSAYYAPGNVEAFKANNGELGNGTLRGATKQVVRWKDTGLLTNGEDIIVKTQGAWIPWDKDGNKTSSQIAVNTGVTMPLDPADEFYDAVVDTDRICGPYEESKKVVGNCTISTYSIPDSTDERVSRYSRPCWLNKGFGAYLLFQRPGEEDPNATMDTMEFPRSPTTHLGHGHKAEPNSDKYSSANGDWGIYGSDCNKIGKPEKGWKIYVKILDNYYYDNAGGYSLEFLGGVMTESRSDIFEYVRRLVVEKLEEAGKSIFSKITNSTEFKNFVFALITLSLVLTSLVYILGMVRTPFTDLIAKVLKIVLVLLLISPNSWNFFYDNLLMLFLKGVDEIIAVINGHTISDKFDASKPFGFMDTMIRDKIFSPVVWEAKARALITADWSSIFALLLIIIAVLFYIGLCMYGFVIYLTAFIGITFLISLMPIMFVGILFSRFKSLFDGWLTQCISFSMQAILMFTLIALFGELIMHYYYRIFGFTACYNEWIHIKLPGIINKKYYEWTPGQKYDSIKIGWGGTEKRGYPEAGSVARYTFTGGGAIITLPPDHKETDFRYVDYPFLDPDTRSKTVPGGVELSKGESHEKLKNLAFYTNSLISTDRATAIGRLVDKIEGELKKLEDDKSLPTDAGNKFRELVKKQRDSAGSGKVDWASPEFKKNISSQLTGTILAGGATPSTSQSELEEQYDYNIIKNIKQGWIVMWSEVFGLILVTFLIWQMRAFVQSIAVVLSGGGMMSRTIASMYDEGFVRIFAGAPIIGRVFETVDRGIDGVRMVARAKLGGIASSVAHVPEKALGRIPVVGGAMSSLVAGTRHVVGGLTVTNTEEDIYTMKSISPRFDYARAWVGAHLGYSPLDALKYIGSYSLAKMSGSTSGGLLDNMRQDRAALLQNVRTLTVGVDKHKPSVYIPGKKDSSGGDNPFRRPDDSRPQQKRPDDDLFDNDGNLHVHKGNFWNAVDTVHALNVMGRKASDDVAKDKIDNDIDRLRGEISQYIRKQPDEIPELRKFVSASGEVDFAALEASALERRGVIETKLQEQDHSHYDSLPIEEHADLVGEATDTSRTISNVRNEVGIPQDMEGGRQILEPGISSVSQGIPESAENVSADMQSEYLRSQEKEQQRAGEEGIEHVSTSDSDAFVSRNVPEDMDSIGSTSSSEDLADLSRSPEKDKSQGLPGEDGGVGAADAAVEDVLRRGEEEPSVPVVDDVLFSRNVPEDMDSIGSTSSSEDLADLSRSPKKDKSQGLSGEDGGVGAADAAVEDVLRRGEEEPSVPVVDDVLFSRNVPEDMDSIGSTSSSEDLADLSRSPKKDKSQGLSGEDGGVGAADAAVETCLQGDDNMAKDLPGEQGEVLLSTKEGPGDTPSVVRENESFEDLFATDEGDFSDAFAEMFDEEKAAAEKEDDDFSDAFAEMFDEEKAAAEKEDDDFSDAFAEMFDEEKAAAEKEDDDFSDAFAEMFDEEKAAAEKEDDDFSDAFAEMFDEEKAAAEKEDDDFSDAFAEMFDEEKAAARAAAEKEEDISDTSAEMFNEEKAAAKAVEGSTKDDEIYSIFASVFGEEKALEEESTLNVEDNVDDDMETLDHHVAEYGSDVERASGSERQETLYESHDGTKSASEGHEQEDRTGKKTQKDDFSAIRSDNKDSLQGSGTGEKDHKQESKGGIYSLKKESSSLTKEETKFLEKKLLDKLTGAGAKSTKKPDEGHKGDKGPRSAAVVAVVKGLGGITKAMIKHYMASKKGSVEYVADRAEIDENRKNYRKSGGNKKQVVESSEKKPEQNRLIEISKLEKELSNLRALMFSGGATGEELKSMEKNIKELENRIKALNSSED